MRATCGCSTTDPRCRVIAGHPTLTRSLAFGTRPGQNQPVARGGRLQLGGALERGRALQLTVDGRPVAAFAGETVATVLFAADIVMTRRTQHGSPRGVFCGMGVCFDCLVVVDGVPNTRACMTWVSDGMRVERQDGLDSAASPAPDSPAQ
jgi:hypothetical protein